MTQINSTTRAVITGGAGGIGSEIARELKKRGAHALIVDINEDALARAKTDLDQSPGAGTIDTIRADVRSVEDLEAVRDHILNTSGGVDLVFNNAGITHYGTFEDLSLPAIQRMMDINLYGVINGCHVFLPVFSKQGHGHIINTASMAAVSGIPRQSVYCASKAGVRAFSESLAAEYSGTKIGVTWLIAGAIATELINNAESKDATSVTLGRLLKSGGMSPNSVARKLLRAVEKNQNELVVTIEGNLTAVANRISPFAVRSSMKLISRVAVMMEARQK